MINSYTTRYTKYPQILKRRVQTTCNSALILDKSSRTNLRLNTKQISHCSSTPSYGDQIIMFSSSICQTCTSFSENK